MCNFRREKLYLENSKAFKKRSKCKKDISLKWWDNTIHTRPSATTQDSSEQTGASENIELNTMFANWQKVKFNLGQWENILMNIAELWNNDQHSYHFKLFIRSFQNPTTAPSGRMSKGFREKDEVAWKSILSFPPVGRCNQLPCWGWIHLSPKANDKVFKNLEKK